MLAMSRKELADFLAAFQGLHSVVAEIRELAVELKARTRPQPKKVKPKPSPATKPAESTPPAAPMPTPLYDGITDDSGDSGG